MEAGDLSAAEPIRLKLTWKNGIFLGCHLVCLGVFWLPFSWQLVALCLALYLVRMFAVTAGFHRYFAHRTYKTSRAFQFVLAVLGATTLQNGPLWWAAHHRRHHRHSDRPGDLHSPSLKGFFHAHVGWLLSDEHDDTDMARVADLARYPELVWLNRNHQLPGVLLALGLLLAGGLPALVWGFFVSTLLTWHVTFCINSLTHMVGRRRYATPDDSRNSMILAILTLGEGWHNNHHHYKSSTRQGFFWWEIDISYYLLRLLALLGLVWGLKEPPRKMVERDRIDGGAGMLASLLPVRLARAVRRR